jgi:hypothetical protein
VSGSGAGAGPEGERAEHKGIHWWRDRNGKVSFYDPNTDQWVRWTAGGDSPPLPPKWQMLGVPTRVTRPGWRSPGRIVPLVVVAAAVIFGIYQALAPSGSSASNEAKAAEALRGKCLAKNGNGGFNATPVPCTDPKAAVKVVSVIPSTPGSPACPPGTTGVELYYVGVQYLHVECTVAVTARSGG